MATGDGSNRLQPTSDGLQHTSDGLQPSSDGLRRPGEFPGNLQDT